MRDLLAEIVAKKRDIVAAAKRGVPLEKLKKDIRCGTFRMAEHFRRHGWGLIAECKLRSPAKGRLTTAHTVTELADIYAASGATVLSVHTDPHFLGSNDDFAAVRARVDTPLLRKDFIIDPYQVYEARALGADAVLLIVRILTPAQLKELLFLTWSLGMDALVEVHDRADLAAALETPAEFIGINNRNLVTFETSVQTTIELLPHADQERTIISESGIFTIEDAVRVRDAGCRGVLVGEGLVKAPDVGAFAKELSGLGAKEQ
ncbi:indole-3-glycerol phosphate synthase TrpC [Selenomonas sp. F0473]|uniref:indole-3-glycerol phosphate synthase TrpC n=1 Tax=Selenomonas sp. F0473 TaxID=999423 RepID=UPI0025D7F44C|nr:indole-3-glycerol phosphate synthase TrpC [Selenomonas sp. F0473]